MKPARKTASVNAVLKPLGFLVVLSSLLAGVSASLAYDASLLGDSKNAKIMRFDDISNMRYCEIFLIGGDPVTKNLLAGVYNTAGLNNVANRRDTCPADMWAKVDPVALKKQYGVLGVFKNGPRFGVCDWIELPVGTQRDFNGLQARWFARVRLPRDFGNGGATYYKPTTVARRSVQGYKKGQTVFILDDPSGTPWVLQAYSLIVDPNLTYGDLKTLDKKLKLPPGWKYRVNVLDRDLTVGAINGIARIVQDDLQGTYNACFEAGNKKSCNFKP